MMHPQRSHRNGRERLALVQILELSRIRSYEK
jgi:hypothetical protein